MNPRSKLARLLAATPFVVLAIGAPLPLVARQQPSVDWAATERAIGRPGQPQPGGVMKFGFPRTDLAVTVGDVRVLPAFALGSWVAFLPSGPGRAIAMGDLVLTGDEVGGALDALEAGDVDATGLHNHLLGETPRILYVHIAAEGDPAAIAAAIHSALARTGTPLAPATATVPPAALDLDTASVAAALGRHGRVNGGVYQVSVPRAAAVHVHGLAVPPSMGVATALNFEPTGGGRAAVTGDFVLTTDEVIPVTRALRAHEILPTAIHTHMLGEEPRLYFMHFWAQDDAVTLARALRAALDHTDSAGS